MSKNRYQLDLTDEGKDELQKLQKKAGHATMREMMIRALSLYEMTVDHIKAGGKVTLTDKNGESQNIKLL